MKRPIALTGTPGTGKTSVARRLTGLRAVEVAELARRWGLARTRSGTVEVDLRGLVRAAKAPGAWNGVDVVVGHLSHLLGLRDVVILRCHPIELDRRLRLAPRGGLRGRTENVASEATDVIRWETAGRGRRVYQIDTTDRTVASVAADVVRFERSRRPGPALRIAWLEDPRVTDYLLDRAR
ncbi:MAG: AAA family ATPase [Thermoplasmata archaeon]|nr:AAA family ATPase [Thermoplasmata archaeon]